MTDATEWPTTEATSNLNQALRQARETSGLSQAALAKLRSVAPSAQADLERAEDLRWSTACRVIETLGGTMRVLIELPDKTHPIEVRAEAQQSLAAVIGQTVTDAIGSGSSASLCSLATRIAEALAPDPDTATGLTVLLAPALGGHRDWAESAGGWDDPEYAPTYRERERDTQSAVAQHLVQNVEYLRDHSEEILNALRHLHEAPVINGARTVTSEHAANMVMSKPGQYWVLFTDFEKTADYLRAGLPAFDVVEKMAREFADDPEYRTGVFAAVGFSLPGGDQ